MLALSRDLTWRRESRRSQVGSGRAGHWGEETDVGMVMSSFPTAPVTTRQEVTGTGERCGRPGQGEGGVQHPKASGHPREGESSTCRVSESVPPPAPVKPGPLQDANLQIQTASHQATQRWTVPSRRPCLPGDPGLERASLQKENSLSPNCSDFFKGKEGFFFFSEFQP